MSKLINLGRAKKQRQRAKKRTKGDQNAVKFGQTKAESQLTSMRTKRDTVLFEHHKIETDE